MVAAGQTRRVDVLEMVTLPTSGDGSSVAPAATDSSSGDDGGGFVGRGGDNADDGVGDQGSGGDVSSSGSADNGDGSKATVEGGDESLGRTRIETSGQNVSGVLCSCPRAIHQATKIVISTFLFY